MLPHFVLDLQSFFSHQVPVSSTSEFREGENNTELKIPDVSLFEVPLFRGRMDGHLIYFIFLQK